MSNSRSPRAVRSMTMGTRGMARRLAGAPDQAAAGVPARGRRRAEQALDAARHAARGPAAACRRRRPARRAVDEHREQREVLGLDAVRGGVELRAASSGGSAVRAAGDERGSPRRAPPAAPALSTSPSAPATRSRDLERGVAAVGVEHDARRGRRRVRRRHSCEAVAVRAAAVEQDDVGRWRATSSSAVVRHRPAAPTGTSPGSVRSSSASPARTAGWGSMTAMRVTREHLPAGS